MDALVIKGPTRLEGEISISGAKNAVLPIMAAAILTKEECVLRNVPLVRDVYSMIQLLEGLGAEVEERGHTLVIRSAGVNKNVADYEHVKKMRASVCLLGPLLARFGQARVSMPGGCVIGARPIDLHLKGLTALGTEHYLDKGDICISAKKFKGGRMYLGGAFGSSVLATANVMMAATLAKGKTEIINAACEPEIMDLGKFLIRMGAKISGLGSPLITIEGVKKLNGCEHKVISDRIEAGTYLLAAATTRGDVTLKGCESQYLGALWDKVQSAGVIVSERKGVIRVKAKSKLQPVSITTHAYPGFPTDLQAQMTTFLSSVPGISVITEKIFPDRFMHISELNRMGADIRLEGPNAIVNGKKKLSGAPVMASDLRASAALVLAGLAAEGATEISRVYHLDRGYEDLDGKLGALGARISRIKT